MAVVAVGDFDPKAIEAHIRRRFGAIPKAARPLDRPTYGVPDHDSTFVAIATDRARDGEAVEGPLTLAPWQGAVVALDD